MDLEAVLPGCRRSDLPQCQGVLQLLVQLERQLVDAIRAASTADHGRLLPALPP